MRAGCEAYLQGLLPQVASDQGVGLPTDIAFLRHYGNLSIAVLRRAQHAAIREGTTAAACLLAQGGVSELLFYRALADYLGLIFSQTPGPLDLDGAPGDAIRDGRARLGPGATARWLIAPTGPAIKALLAENRLRQSPSDAVMTTPTRLSALVRRACADSIELEAREALLRRDPDLCAKNAVCRRLYARLFCATMVVFAATLVVPTLSAALTGLLFFTAITFRLLICAAGLTSPSQAEPSPLSEDALPRYSVLVPLRGEAEIVLKLVERLDQIDYPRSKIAVTLLVEEDDPATQRACFAARLAPHYEIIVVPKGKPQTKPRALNVALPLVKGDLITVYDAEDAPDPNQLRKAAARFHSKPALACVQARLAIRNSGSCLLARLFAVDYAGLFDLFNLGVAECGLPMALGGTSNHFRLSVLREIGGWDAWNVAEDADLGFRLARFGYKTECLVSTTMEDAPTDCGNWLRQRRRWTKGWMQTAIVLGRDPRRLHAELGTTRALAMLLMLTMLVLGPLASLPLTGLAIFRLMAFGLPQAETPLELMDATLWTCVFIAGPALTLWTGYVGSRARSLKIPIPTLICLLPYQAMISIAAWGGLYDLCRNPYHWHKTHHGSSESTDANGGASRNSKRTGLSGARPRQTSGFSPYGLFAPRTWRRVGPCEPLRRQ